MTQDEKKLKNDSLITFIREAAYQGKAEEDIVREGTGRGWSEDEIVKWYRMTRTHSIIGIVLNSIALIFLFYTGIYPLLPFFQVGLDDTFESLLLIAAPIAAILLAMGSMAIVRNKMYIRSMWIFAGLVLLYLAVVLFFV